MRRDLNAYAGLSDDDLSNSSEDILTKSSASKFILEEKKSCIIPDQGQMKSYHLKLFPSNSDGEIKSADEEKTQRVRKYLFEKRKLSEAVLRKYQVGWAVQQFLDDDGKLWVEHLCVTFPWIKSTLPSRDIKDEESEDEVSRKEIISIRNFDSAFAAIQTPIDASPQNELPTIIRMKFRS